MKIDICNEGFAPPVHDKDDENDETLKYGKDNDTNRILKDTDSEEGKGGHR